MNRLKWNIGIMIIHIGYIIRKRAWKIGVPIVGFGYKLRGNIPKKHYWKNLSV